MRINGITIPKDAPILKMAQKQAHYKASLLVGLERMTFFYSLFLSHGLIESGSEKISMLFMMDVFLAYYYEVLLAIDKHDPGKLKQLGIKRVKRTFGILRGARNNVFHIPDDEKQYWKRTKKLDKFLFARKNENLQRIVDNTMLLIEYRDNLRKEMPGLTKLYDY